MGDLRARLLHGRGPPGPSARRLQGRDRRGLEAAGEPRLRSGRPRGGGRRALAAPPAPKPGDSLVFDAVTDKRGGGAAAAAAGQPPAPKAGDSLQFIKAVEPQPAAAAPAEAVAAAAGQVTGPDAYPGDDAPREQLAAWMAKEAQKRDLPPESPVMAALAKVRPEEPQLGDA